MKRLLFKQSQVILSIVILIGAAPLSAQNIFLGKDAPKTSLSIFTYNIGYATCMDGVDHGESAWKSGDNEYPTGLTNTLKYMRYSSKNAFGYGIKAYDYLHKKKHHPADDKIMKEKINLLYVAPQLGYLKRHTAFKRVYGVVEGGAGYVHYSSSMESLDAKCSSVGFNIGLACEYMFAKEWGIRLGVDCLYSPINPDYNAQAAINSTFAPRGKFGMALMNVELGVSTHF